MKKALFFILPALVFIGCIAFSVFSCIEQKPDFDQYKDWQQSNGRIYERENPRKEDGNLDFGHYTYYYTFTADGRQYNGVDTLRQYTRVQKYSHTYYVGDVVGIWYDPDDPTVNAMSKPSALGADFYFPLIFALPLAFGCMALLAKPLLSDD